MSNTTSTMSADAIRAASGVSVLVIKQVERAPRATKSADGAPVKSSFSAEEKQRRDDVNTVGRVLAFRGKELKFPNAHAAIHHADRVRQSLKTCELFLANPAAKLDAAGMLNKLSVFESIVREIQAAWMAIPPEKIQAEAVRRIDFNALLQGAGIVGVPDGVNFDEIPSMGRTPEEWYSDTTTDDTVMQTEVSELTVANSWTEFATNQLDRIGKVGDQFAEGLVPNVTPEASEAVLSMLRGLRAKWRKLNDAMRRAAYRLNVDYVGKSNKRNDVRPQGAHRMSNRF